MIPADCFESLIRMAFLKSSEIIKHSQSISDGFIEREIKISTDRELDLFFREYLESRTSIPVYSEESKGVIDPLVDLCWIVDPLDGSLNYLKKIPFFTSSIGLWKNGQAIAGFVFDYSHNDFYSGIVNGPAKLNDQKISISSVKASNGIIATGIPSYSNIQDSLKNFETLLGNYKKLRWLGCASLSLCYVACGKIEAYEELGIKLWDVAAGIAIVSAAGAKVDYKLNKDLSLNLKVLGGVSE